MARTYKKVKAIVTGHLMDKRTGKPARLEDICPLSPTCMSKPAEELPNCIPNYADCMVYKFIMDEKDRLGYNPEHPQIIKFFQRYPNYKEGKIGIRK